jgi:hypothetical protein
MRNLLPEEEALENGEAGGIVVRLHRLSWFQVASVAILQRDSLVTVTRRELKVGPRGLVVPQSQEEFHCSSSFPDRLFRDLRLLGINRVDSYFAEHVLDGTTLSFRLRQWEKVFHQVHLFCWDYSEEEEVRQVGDYLQHLALTSIRRLRWRAFASRFGF